jgi:selenide,water dikinase
MGGRPLTALSVVGFPIGTVADEVLREILRGGVEKMAEAGVAVIGGHSIKDPEIKAGFAVTGVVDPRHLMLRAGARPGDVLILTKPLGTGIIAFASQIDRAPPGAMEAAARSMAALNKTAAQLMVECGAHGCTDVTGFGLMGHLAEMAAGGKVNAEIVWDDLPLLPGVLECVAEGIIPGSVERNRESCAAAVTLGRGATPAMLDVCMDAQTSGGLLIAVAKAKAAGLLKRLHKAGVAEAAVIGKVRGRGTGRVFLVTRGRRPIPESNNLDAATRAAGGAAYCPDKETDMAKKAKSSSCCADEPSCCAEGHGVAPAAPGAAVSAIQAKFRDFMKAANAPGALDAATKQALAIALSVAARCDPCTRNHIKKARDMGFSQDEIDEAAWMAIAFGGSPVMMFYEGVRGV